MIQCDPLCYIFAASLILFLPANWLLSAATAVLLHECCHILIVSLLHGNIRKIHISIGGCEISCDGLGDIETFFSILAGPAGSLSLLLLRKTAPMLAICGLFHGVYNLLPVLPLDGGRILQLLLYRFLPQKATKIMAITGCITSTLVACLAISMIIWFRAGFMAGLFSVICILKMLPGKIPCKPGKIRVQ